MPLLPTFSHSVSRYESKTMEYKYENVKDDNYFRKVLRNMSKRTNPKESIVYFGETGKGITPHYMIVDSNSEKHIFNGQNHMAFGAIPTDQFSEGSLSPSLTFENVRQEIDKRYNRPRSASSKA
jgi:hypothetical protein